MPLHRSPSCSLPFTDWFDLAHANGIERLESRDDNIVNPSDTPSALDKSPKEPLSKTLITVSHKEMQNQATEVLRIEH